MPASGAGSPVARLPLYSGVADATASGVIRRYSTSFGAASRLLGPGVRQHVENVYALVRVADEIVDGAAAEAGLDPDAARAVLDGYEAEAEAATRRGYSADLVVHAFACTAREVGIGTELTAPFFRSMRTDVDRSSYDPAGFAEYVHGSAEVVGLMCLRAFVQELPDAEAAYERMSPGARALGAAFQKVNFLRDLRADVQELGRSYFPGIDVTRLTEADKLRLVDDIDADLAAAAAVIPMLPSSSRRAVALAHALFAELNRRLRAAPATELLQRRVRVPDPVKLRLGLLAAAGRLA
ncbi:MAG: squalene/phytoene synthase family protein [Micrococcales bacterium]|nr:squalene/phytoene synthase family protein [Micrococcales bacterium]